MEDWNYTKSNTNQNAPRVKVDRAQWNDPLFDLFSEVQHPEVLRKVLADWRKGAEIRFKMPYYPETKKPEQWFI